MDGTGYIYRKRVNDLIIHITAAIYAFLPPSQIHRFLDFTYQHFTRITSIRNVLCDGVLYCWRVYADEHALETVMRYHATEIVAKQCPRPGEKKPYFPRAMNIIVQQDLSPTYHHLTDIRHYYVAGSGCWLLRFAKCGHSIGIEQTSVHIQQG